MVPFMGVRNVAAKALKMPGVTPVAVREALLALYAEGRPLTLNVLGHRLSGAKAQGSASAHTDHWAAGGSFIND